MAAAEEKIVVDTNVLISALINPGSVVLEVIGVEDLDFLVPEIVVN